MAAIYRAPERRTRTLLQSFDTARFHGDEQADKLADINQARSEILSAVLLGHEIVLPAGIVADCPAATVLIPEVMPAYLARKEKIRTHAGKKYDPFRIGVERRFASSEAPAYDLFVRDYLASLETRLTRWRNFEDMAGRADAQKAVLDAGKNYLTRDWKAIRSALGPYVDYAFLVANIFSRDDGDHADPVLCKDGKLTAPGDNSIERAMKRFLRVARDRGVSDDDIAGLSSGTATAIGRIRAGGGRPGERGAWYTRAEDFGEQWQYARNWLDQILYQRLVHAFSIDLPSFFAQELEDDERDFRLGLAYVSDEAFRRFETEASLGKPSLPPALASIAWETIWDLVAEEDVQHHQNRLQARLSSARTAARSDLLKLARSKPADWETRARQRKENFAQEVGDAVDEYLEFLRSGDKTVLLKRKGPHLMAEAGKQPKSLKGTKTGTALSLGTALGIGATIDTTTPTMGLATATMLGITALETVTGPIISDRIIAVVDRVRRPRNRDVASEAQFYDAIREQVNFWVVPPAA